MHKNITELLIRPIFIVFILFIVSLFTFADNKDFYMISHMLFIVFIILTGIYLLFMRSFTISFFNIYLLIWAFWALLSSLWSIDFNFSFNKAATIIQLIILSIFIYEFFKRQKSVDIYIKSLLIGGGFMCIYTINFYGIDHIINGMNSRVRLGSEISQINTMGINAAITFIICLFFILYRRRLLLIPILALPFIIALSSGSRKSLIIIIIGSISLLLFKYGIRKIYKFFLMLLLLFTVFVIILQHPMFELVHDRMLSFFNLFTDNGKVDNSTLQRMQMIEIGLDFIKEKALFGYGLDSFRTVYFNIAGVYTYSHNNYIELLFSGGLVGLFIYYIGYIYLINKLIPEVIKKDSYAILILTIILINLFIDMARVSYYSKLQYIYLCLGYVYIDIINRKNKVKYE